MSFLPVSSPVLHSKLEGAAITIRSSHQRCSLKKGVLRNLPQACNFIKKETLRQVFSCEFCEISEHTFFTKHLRATASVLKKSLMKHFISCAVMINFLKHNLVLMLFQSRRNENMSFLFWYYFCLYFVFILQETLLQTISNDLINKEYLCQFLWAIVILTVFQKLFVIPCLYH